MAKTNEKLFVFVTFFCNMHISSIIGLKLGKLLKTQMFKIIIFKVFNTSHILVERLKGLNNLIFFKTNLAFVARVSLNQRYCFKSIQKMLEIF